MPIDQYWGKFVRGEQITHKLTALGYQLTTYLPTYGLKVFYNIGPHLTMYSHHFATPSSGCCCCCYGGG